MVSGAERQLQKIDSQGWKLLFWCRMASDPESLKSKLIKGASKTYLQQAGTICKNGYIIIKARPCKVFFSPFYFFFF